MQKVLIIGGTGYIGSHLYNFLKNDFEVDTVDLEWFGNCVNDKNSKIDMSELSATVLHKYNSIILLAGHSSVKMCDGTMTSTMKNNVLNFVELLEKISADQTFIYASSSSVYGDTEQLKVTEEYNKFEPNNFYDLSKQEIDSYASLTMPHKRIFGLRFGTVNGASPNLRNDIMINAMVYNGLKNGKVYCFNPEIHRPILGIRDLCRAIGAIVSCGTDETKGIYNLSSFNTTALEISTKVASLLGVELEVVDTLPEVISNVKLQTKAYNFMIDSTKFSKTFQFEFLETVETIVQSLIDDFADMRKENRSSVKLY